MAKAEIDAGICGFQTTCIATKNGDGTVSLAIESGCSAVMKLAEQLQTIEPFKEAFWRRSLPRTIELAPKCLSHPACPVPSGIIKAIEVEAGLALPKDVTIRVSKSDEYGLIAVMSESLITETLLASLRRQGSRFPTQLRDIEVSLAALELPRAFRLMNTLKERGIWQLTPEEDAALEDFWWEYGQ